MSTTSTAVTDLTAAEKTLGTLKTQLAGSASVSTSLANAAASKSLSGAQSSAKAGLTRLAAAESTLASVLSSVQAALAAINTPPTPPTPPAPVTPQPAGISGNWKLLQNFDFTRVTALDSDIWDDGWWATQRLDVVLQHRRGDVLARLPQDHLHRREHQSLLSHEREAVNG